MEKTIAAREGGLKAADRSRKAFLHTDLVKQVKGSANIFNAGECEPYHGQGTRFMVYNEDQDKKAYAKAKAKAKAIQEEIDEACKALLSVPRGRAYLWWLLQIGRVGGQPFTPNALQTSFACGELNVGNQILAHIISVDPAGYVRMMQEQADAQRSSNDTGGDTDTDTDSDTDDSSAD